MMDDHGQRAVLGIDAAWTSTERSGVALAVETEDGWRLKAVAASYDQFIGRAKGVESGEERPRGCKPDAAALLDAARRQCGRRVALVAVDMPLSHRRIEGRRCCDDRISAEFGARGAGTHSPSAVRPGPLSDEMTEQFETLSYRLCTSEPATRLIEVYPHTALIRFLDAPYRLEYKATKAGRYWPTLTLGERQAKLHTHENDGELQPQHGGPRREAEVRFPSQNTPERGGMRRPWPGPSTHKRRSGTLP